MVDFNKPTAASIYDPDFLNELADKDFYAGSLGFSAPTNTPTHLVRLNRTGNILEEWDGAVWNALPIGVGSGGTGAVTAAAARTNLGIGTLGVQGASAVAITGGTISGITALALAGNITFDADDAYDIGAFATRPKRIYVRSALVIPSGVDKYATS